MMDDLFGGTLPASTKPKQVYQKPPRERDEIDDILDFMAHSERICEYPITRTAASLLGHLRDNPEITDEQMKKWQPDMELLIRLRCIKFANREFPLIAYLDEGVLDVYDEIGRRVNA
jgi:hypothetical protein